jgi:CRP-like cAMP-binding protein
LLAQVTPDITVDLEPGACVGEMALFEGGKRTADVRAAMDPSGNDEDALVAVLTYAELGELTAVLPSLGHSLYVLFAATAMRKLRRIHMTAAQLAEMAQREQERLWQSQRRSARMPSRCLMPMPLLLHRCISRQ